MKRNKSSDPTTGHRIAAAAALVLAFAVLASALTVCHAGIKRFSDRALLLIDSAFSALHEGKNADAHRAVCELDRMLAEEKDFLMLVISHRDIAELMSCSREAAALGETAGLNELAEPLCALGTMIALIEESDRLTIGNVL